MAIDVITSILVGLLGLVSAVLFVKGVVGMFVTDAHEARHHW